jgi:hypothetical protein
MVCLQHVAILVFTETQNKWKKCFFVLRDSHLIMYFSGDTLIRPRGVMYLDGTTITVIENKPKSTKSGNDDDDDDEDDERPVFAISIVSKVSVRDSSHR